MPTLAPIAGCPLVTLAPEPCPPTWPPDPPGLTLEALGIRAAMTAGLRGTPRTDPPFTASHWVARTGLPVPGNNVVPTGSWVQFKGHLYLSYGGVASFIQIPGAPVRQYVHIGSIHRSADAVTWAAAFTGDYLGTGWSADQLRRPGRLWVRGDTLYAVISQGSYSWVEPFAYIGPGEVAIWKTTDGTTWTKHQVLAAWTAHGNAENVGGTASRVSFGGQSAWRAAGSGPAGEVADWLGVQYAAHANVPGTPFSVAAAPQFRSLDNGQTWTQVRDMLGPTFPAGPGAIFTVPRPGELVDRWAMVGGGGPPRRSDDAGATWSDVTSGSLWPDWGLILPVGGGLTGRHGSLTAGPASWVSCDYYQSIQSAPAPVGDTESMYLTLQFPEAGGEEVLAVTRRAGGDGIWHSTNGGESWEDRGTIATGFTVWYALARAPTGRVLLFPVSGGGADVGSFTCDDAPIGVASPRTICSFTVPGAPVGQIAGCASLTFVTELCGALPPPPVGPGADTCLAPLGLFVLGETCLGAPGLVPLQSTRARSLPHAR